MSFLSHTFFIIAIITVTTVTIATIIVTYICFNISAGCNYLWRTGKILQRDVCEPDDGEGHNDDDGHKNDDHNDDDDERKWKV